MKVDLGSNYYKKIERMSSIEKEPQTLSLAQIKYAREAALYVLSTSTIEEALRIFTEGLQPVINIENEDTNLILVDSDDDVEKSDGIMVDEVLLGLRDTATAPF